MPQTAELQAKAYAARAAGDHDTAVTVWRLLLDQAPEDWTLALQLKHDLKAGYHYPDSDPRFRRAARHLPDREWRAHYTALYAFHGSDLDAIDARARSLLLQSRDDAPLHALLGDVASQRRDWPQAASAFAAAHRLDPTHPDYALKQAKSALYQRLAAQPWPAIGPPYPIHVVNLDRNPERMVELDRQFAASPVPRRRIPAIEGSRLPAAAVQRLTGNPAAPRGTLGCFLSHAAAWEALLASPAPAALIIEDDVIPLLNLPPRLGALALPPGWDLVFVNDRLEPRRNPAQTHSFTTHPLAAVMQSFPIDDNAPGGDGYFISRTGAQHLLAWTAEDGMAEDVDWRLLAYALTQTEIAAIPTQAHAHRELARLTTQIPRSGRLQAHVLHPALIRTVGVSSDREDQNRLNPPMHQ